MYTQIINRWCIKKRRLAKLDTNAKQQILLGRDYLLHFVIYTLDRNMSQITAAHFKKTVGACHVDFVCVINRF
jgi:hypothetical protein